MKEQIYLNKITNFMIVFSTILLYFNSRIDANVFKMIFIIFFIMVLFRKYKNDFSINKNILFFSLFVFLNFSFYPNLFIQNLFTLLYFLIIYTLYHYYILRNDIFNIVSMYIYISFLMALVGIFQEVLFLISPEYLFYISEAKNPDFVYGEQFNILRIASFLDEPSKLGLFILPAIVFGVGKYLFSMYLIKISKFQFIILVIGFLLTFSAHAYLSLILIILILLFSNENITRSVKYSLLIIGMLILPFIFSLDVVSEKLINTGLFNKELDLESSTIATSAFFYIGFQCIVDIFTSLNWFGVGMGNYSILAQPYWNNFGLNVLNDDGSTIGYARIIVEFGLVGLTGLIFFMYKTIIKTKKIFRDENINSLVFINHISMLFIIVDLFRMGFYINPPIIFFIALFVVSKIQYLKLIKKYSI